MLITDSSEDFEEITDVIETDFSDQIIIQELNKVLETECSQLEDLML